jgi:hypothetical protein
MIEQGQGVQSTLSVRNLLAGIGRSTMAACIRHDERVLTDELVATGMRPIVVASGAAMKKQERLSRALRLVIHLDIAELDPFVLHDAQLWPRAAKQTILEMRVIQSKIPAQQKRRCRMSTPVVRTLLSRCFPVL